MQDRHFRLSTPDTHNISRKIRAKAVNPIREGLNGDPLVWPKEAGAPKLLQDLVDQLALAIDGTQTVEQSLENAQGSWDKALT